MKIVIKDRAHMSIGRSWSVGVLSDEGSASQFYSGNAYHYGMLPPRYPVPAIPIEVTYEVIGDTLYQDTWISIDPCTHTERTMHLE